MIGKLKTIIFILQSITVLGLIVLFLGGFLDQYYEETLKTLWVMGLISTIYMGIFVVIFSSSRYIKYIMGENAQQNQPPLRHINIAEIPRVWAEEPI